MSAPPATNVALAFVVVAELDDTVVLVSVIAYAPIEGWLSISAPAMKSSPVAVLPAIVELMMASARGLRKGELTEVDIRYFQNRRLGDTLRRYDWPGLSCFRRYSTLSQSIESVVAPRQ